MGMFDYTVNDIFSFEKRDVTRHMMYELHLGGKVKDSFKYLCSKLGVKDVPKDWSRVKWSKGKNYHWLILKKDNVTFAIRQYHSHYTIFSKREKGADDWNAKFSIFTFETDLDQLSDREKDTREWTDDLAKYIDQLFEFAAQDKIWALWNNLMFKREKHIKVKCVWSGSEDDISDIDLFNFACEEIFQKFLEVFSENDMLERVKEIRVGQQLGAYTVTSVMKAVKDDYYHGVGIKWKNDREEKWNDVYALTRWHFNEMFPKGFNLWAIK